MNSPTAVLLSPDPQRSRITVRRTRTRDRLGSRSDLAGALRTSIEALDVDAGYARAAAVPAAERRPSRGRGADRRLHRAHFTVLDE